jgi:sugar phosphate isomerase/epimerase
MKLSFMTFVCPDWKIEKIVEFAKGAGYDGVELRVDEGHKHEVSSKSSSTDRRYVKGLFRDKSIEVPCIATSVQFGFRDPVKRKENVEAAKANIELAGYLGAKVIRIFAGGDAGKMTDEAAAYIADAFTEVGEYGRQFGVCPMLETLHDIVTSSEDSMAVLGRVKSTNFGILWNHSEIDPKSFELLKGRIRHFHVHDEVLDPANENILHLSKMMKGVNYDGYVSLEIIKGYTLPEDLLIETAKRLKGYIERS